MTKEKTNNISERIKIPAEIKVIVEVKDRERELLIKKDNKEIRRKVDPLVNIKIEGDEILVTGMRKTKQFKKRLGTTVGNINNMINGLIEEFEYELEICSVHFPMSVEFDKTKKEVSIKNIIGEKYPRKLKVAENVEVSIKPPKIIIKSYDINLAGQTAADIEKRSKIRNRDRNKFQDGIYITKKPGRVYL